MGAARGGGAARSADDDDDGNDDDDDDDAPVAHMMSSSSSAGGGGGEKESATSRTTTAHSMARRIDTGLGKRSLILLVWVRRVASCVVVRWLVVGGKWLLSLLWILCYLLSMYCFCDSVMIL